MRGGLRFERLGVASQSSVGPPQCAAGRTCCHRNHTGEGDEGSPTPACIQARLRDAGAVSRRLDLAGRSEDAAGSRTEGCVCGTRLAPNSWSRFHPWLVVPMANSGRPGRPRLAQPMRWTPPPPGGHGPPAGRSGPARSTCRMNMRPSPYVPALAGLICGILSTVPVELRFVPSMLLWGGVGLAIGLLIRQRRDAVAWGGLYGLFLLVGFFGAHLVADTKALHNLLFDVLAVILTPVGALVAVAVGARLSPRSQQSTE